MDRTELTRIHFPEVRISTIGLVRIGYPPGSVGVSQGITDALLMEDGALMLSEDGIYISLEGEKTNQNLLSYGNQRNENQPDGRIE